MNWFLSVDDAREKIDQWQQDYNEFRLVAVLSNCCSPLQPGPRSRLENLPPDDYVDRPRGRKFLQTPVQLMGKVQATGIVKRCAALLARMTTEDPRSRLELPYLLMEQFSTGPTMIPTIAGEKGFEMG